MVHRRHLGIWKPQCYFQPYPPLKAIYKINQAKEDRIVPMDNSLKRFTTLFGFTVRSWQRKNRSAPTMAILERVCEEIPMANIYFTKSEKIVKKLLQEHFPESDQ